MFSLEIWSAWRELRRNLGRDEASRKSSGDVNGNFVFFQKFNRLQTEIYNFCENPDQISDTRKLTSKVVKSLEPSKVRHWRYRILIKSASITLLLPKLSFWLSTRFSTLNPWGSQKYKKCPQLWKRCKKSFWFTFILFESSMKKRWKPFNGVRRHLMLRRWDNEECENVIGEMLKHKMAFN